MVVNSPVSDFFTRLENAVLRRRRKVSVPYSKLKEQIAKVLVKEGYLSNVKKSKDTLILKLNYRRRKPVIMDVRIVSKPGLRIYRKRDQLPSPLGGAGISIVSTSKGIMSDKEARKKGVGGEVIAEIW